MYQHGCRRHVGADPWLGARIADGTVGPMNSASEDNTRTVLHRSVHTARATSAPRPRLRGLLHLVAALVAVPGALVWIVAASSWREVIAFGAFAGGIAAMFVASALLHVRPWPPATHERLLRLDHTGIYLAISGTGIGVALLGLSGWPRVVLATGAIIGAALGIAVEWLPFAPPRGYSNTVYLTLGWTPVVLLPWLWQMAGADIVVLLVIGGVLYTVGAVIVGLRRPDPLPRWFGFHELFHLLVIAAVAVHVAMVLRLT